MLILHDIHKYYQSKNTEKVHALKGINLKFGSKGFIVLLGKSGSGKSTLLNILGGLDNFDSGEIIVKDKTTQDFHRNDWDSYRNTYVGFVFQEFYIIEEFSVGKNIALALELQGYPKDEIDVRVEEILKQVDLEGYKNRGPNEISGGQKQRIAIARALVKDPQIILADEPTGNLDSETGLLILKTLKKLSKTKLVIMVTHDAEFANEFGDRIIELKDGIAISDKINYHHPTSKAEIFDVNDKVKAIIKLPIGKQLTQNTINYINQLLLKGEKELYISLSHDEDYIKTFVPDIDKKIVDKSHIEDLELFLKEESIDEFAIKYSSLPFHYAFKLALSSLFTKKLKLIFMTLLFILSLVFVGMATSFSFYNADTAASLTFKKAGITTIPIIKVEEICYEKNHCYKRDITTTDSDIRFFKTKYPTIQFFKTIHQMIPFSDLTQINPTYNKSSYYTEMFNKITILNDNGFQVIGNYPIQDHEIMITDYMADMLIYHNIFAGVTEIENIIGKHFTYQNSDIVISGIVKTNYEQFKDLEDLSYDVKQSQKTLAFYTLQESVFQQMFMKQNTYDLIFREKYTELYPIIINEQKGIGYPLQASPVNDQLSNHVIGHLPQKKDEVVFTLTQIANLFNSDVFEMTSTQLENFIENKTITFQFESYVGNSFQLVEKVYKIVGILNDIEDKSIGFDVMMNNDELAELKTLTNNNLMVTITSRLGNNQSENKRFINDLDQLNYRHHTEYSNMLSLLKNLTSNTKTTLYIIGAVFATFASFLIFTFISSSVANKQKEIGTLRAIGARGIDVSKIFIIEGLIIGLFSSIVSSIISGILIYLINHSITKEFKIDLVLLYTNPLSILTVFVLSIIVIIISTFIPLKRITLMKPIKAIKNIK